MGAPNTALVPQPKVQYEYYDEVGRQVDQSYHPEFAEWPADTRELFVQHQNLVRELAIEKPKWAVTAEEISRKFLRRQLGIISTAPVFLLREDPLLAEAGVGDTPPLTAWVDPPLMHVMVREEKLREIYDEAGMYATAGFLAHEEFHAAAPVDRIAVQKTAQGPVVGRYRTGLVTIGSKGIRGAFIEEGAAVLIQAMCTQKQTTVPADMGAASKPSLKLPPRYAEIHQAEKGKQARVAGPDGYAIELLTRDIDRKDIMPAHEFIRLLAASRRPELYSSVIRKLAHAIDAIRPGLYFELQSLQYGAKDWRRGLRQVHKAVATKR
jgi:hypothetical protein